MQSTNSNSDRKIVRWYLMVYPGSRRGIIEGVERELERRKRNGEVLFEYFAPAFVEAKEVNGKIVKTQTQLLFNYIFIHSSESEIYKIKKNEPQYNFLPRVNNDDGGYHYPYISDDSMRTLKWIARSYSGAIPLYTSDPVWIKKGDRVRIIKGRLKGMKAHVVSVGKSNQKDIMVFIDNWMSVPLVQIKEGDYEIIELNNKVNETPLKVDTTQEMGELHKAICKYYNGTITAKENQLAQRVVQKYANITADSNVARCKVYSLLLMAYTILGSKKKLDSLIGIIQAVLPTIKSEQSMALLLVTLYGCTDNSLYYDRAHALLAPWKENINLKKSKQQLLDRLADYDRILGH